MDVGQSGIKITQTNQLQSSLFFKTKQKENTILSFNQVLAMATLGGQSSPSGNLLMDNSSPESLVGINNTVKTASEVEPDQTTFLDVSIGFLPEHPDQTEVRTDEWNGLFSILTSLMDVFQQYQINPIEDGNSQFSLAEAIHNPVDAVAIENLVTPVNAEQVAGATVGNNLLDSLPRQPLMDTEILQSSPYNEQFNNRLLDTLVSEAIRKDPLQKADTSDSNFSNIDLGQNKPLHSPIKVIQPVRATNLSNQFLQLDNESNQDINLQKDIKDQKININGAIQTVTEDDLGLTDSNVNQKGEEAPLKQVLPSIQMKLSNLLTGEDQKTWNDLNDNSSFIKELTSLLDDLQMLNNQVLPGKVIDLSEKLNKVTKQLLSNNQLELQDLPFSRIQLGSPQDQKLPNAKNSQNLALNFDVNSIIFSPSYQEKRITDSNRVKNGTLAIQQTDDKNLDGQSLLTNQALNNPTQLRSSDHVVESIPILPINDFVPEIKEFVGSFVKLKQGEFGSTEAKFSLFPENLGHVGVKIVTHDGQITAQIITETPVAKQALEGQLHQLRQALLEQGLVVQKLDIIQQPAPSGNTNQADLSFSQGNSGFSREHRTPNPEENDMKKQISTEQLELDTETHPIQYQGAVSKSTSNIDFTA